MDFQTVKNAVSLEKSVFYKNEHIPIEKLKKIINYEVQEIFKSNSHLEKENKTTNIEILREDYKRVINKYNTLAKRYTKVKNIVQYTMKTAENIQIENINLKNNNQTLQQEIKKLKNEVIKLKEYINQTFEYVSLLFDFSKDTLKKLVNSFIDKINSKTR